MATCAVCGTSFSGRSDAVYCSGACRQKAHRARAARRIEGLRERASRHYLTPVSNSEAAVLRRSVAKSMVRAREQVDRSRELCRTSAARLQQAAAIQRQFGSTRAGDAITTAEAARWHGN